MTGAARIVLLALLLALPACGGDGGGNADEASTGGTAPPAMDEDEDPGTAVAIVVYPASLGGGARRFELACDPPGGTHPRPKQACEALAANVDALEPVPKDVACTQEFGGRDRAEVHGTVDGEEVEASFNRRNGCEIARWDRLAPLLNIE